MSKYKVHDIVEIVGTNTADAENNIGYIGIVTSVHPGNWDGNLEYENMCGKNWYTLDHKLSAWDTDLKRSGTGIAGSYKTKDSGKRQEYNSGMRRDTQDGKPRYDLLIPKGLENHMLKRWAMLMERGMDKYGYRNWELADSQEEFIRFKQSAFRHFIQWFDGEEDEDHASAVFFNIQAAEFLKHKLNDTAKGQTSNNTN